MFCVKSKPDWPSELGWIFSALIYVEEYKSYGIRGHFKANGNYHCICF